VRPTRLVAPIGFFLLGAFATYAYLRKPFDMVGAEQGAASSLASVNTQVTNPAVYFEIPILDVERAKRFYGTVFGYKFSEEEIHGNRMINLPFSDKASGITGALAKGKTYVPSGQGSLIYLDTVNIATTLEKATSAGGSVLFPKTQVGELGYAAEIKDSEGNRVGLFEKRKK
jgi:uncharacterized protein